MRDTTTKVGKSRPLTVFFAKIVGDRYGVGIDDTHVRLRGAPVLDEPALDVGQQMVDDKLTVSELMTTSLIALSPVVPVRRLVDTLRMCNHQAFPVTPEVEKALGVTGEPFELHGLILRSTLLRLLRSRRGFIDPQESSPLPLQQHHQQQQGANGGGSSSSSRGRQLPGQAVLANGSVEYAAAAAAAQLDERSHVPSRQKERLAAIEEMQQIPLKIRVREEQEGIIAALAPGDFDSLLDLRPFMQRSPYVVNEDASLSRGYRLFRTMGLRHMFVSPPHPLVSGMVTRKDIITDNAKLALGRKANLGLVESQDAQALRRRLLPFIPYSAYDPTAGSSRVAPADSSASLGVEGEESGAGEGMEGAEEGDALAGDRFQHAITQRRRAGETELASVGVE